jgi:hypothetical protein
MIVFAVINVRKAITHQSDHVIENHRPTTPLPVDLVADFIVIAGIARYV